MRRLVLLGAPAVGLVLLAVMLGPVDLGLDGADDVWWLETIMLSVFLPVAGATVVIGALVAAAVGGSRGVDRAALPVLSLGVVIGAVALLPVERSWNDGCNDQYAVVPLVVAPYIDREKPDDVRLSYDGIGTLVGCGAQPAPVGASSAAASRT